MTTHDGWSTADGTRRAKRSAGTGRHAAPRQETDGAPTRARRAGDGGVRSRARRVGAEVGRASPRVTGLLFALMLEVEALPLDLHELFLF